MAEIALALAMGFFSIMVLTMVSMGAGSHDTETAVGAILVPASEESAERGALKPNPEDVVVIYSDGRFFDSQLQAIDPQAITGPGRVILAFKPDVPMAEAMSARSAIGIADLIVSTLDERWLAAVAEVER